MDAPFNNNHFLNSPADASKIADGSVSNAEYQRLDGVTSAIQTQIDTKLTGTTSTVETLLASVAGVDLNVVTKTTLYTVPGGKTFIPTKIITRNASTSLTTAIFGFGFNASANDVVVAALHTALVDNTVFTIDTPMAGSKVGAAASVFGVECSLAQGVAATCTIDVFGYLI